VRPGPDAELGLLRQSRAIERVCRERGLELEGLLSDEPGSAGDPGPALRRALADGWTLQAIADELNADGVPTLRGGAEWRPSSVQSAAGYKRPDRGRGLDGLPGNAALPTRTDALAPG
jgi:hypothetical protein